jgi:hypothetical protein
MKRSIRQDMARECPDFAFPKQHRTKDRHNRKASAPEAPLQSFTNSFLEAKGVPYIRIPEEVYYSIFANPSIPVHVKKWVSENIKGLPDNVCILPITPKFNLCWAVELKSDIGKQTARQRDWARQISVVVARTQAEIVAGLARFMTVAERLKADLAEHVERLEL